MATTSLWMFPIYGLAAFIPHFYEKIKRIPWLIRGILYTIGIFAIEYLTGSILCFFHICPWDYSGSPINYKGIIRLDYAPFWFLLGLFYERLLLHVNAAKTSATAEKVAEQIKQ